MDGCKNSPARGDLSTGNNLLMSPPKMVLQSDRKDASDTRDGSNPARWSKTVAGQGARSNPCRTTSQLMGVSGRSSTSEFEARQPREMNDPSIPTFTWQTIKSGPEGPGRRSRHGLAYDRGARATVLFGGLIWVGDGAVQSDTWELKDGHWSEVKLFNHPPARHRGAMVFDAYRGFSVLFGGQADNGVMFGGTWIYAGRRWRECHMRRWAILHPQFQSPHAVRGTALTELLTWGIPLNPDFLIIMRISAT